MFNIHLFFFYIYPRLDTDQQDTGWHLKHVLVHVELEQLVWGPIWLATLHVSTSFLYSHDCYWLIEMITHPGIWPWDNWPLNIDTWPITFYISYDVITFTIVEISLAILSSHLKSNLCILEICVTAKMFPVEILLILEFTWTQLGLEVTSVQDVPQASLHYWQISQNHWPLATPCSVPLPLLSNCFIY